MDDLVTYTANHDLQVLQGNKVIEVRNRGINKGNAASEYLSNEDLDFILAFGDDNTDEDLFKVLPEDAFSIKIGINRSSAKYNIHNVNEVNQLLYQLINNKEAN